MVSEVCVSGVTAQRSLPSVGRKQTKPEEKTQLGLCNHKLDSLCTLQLAFLLFIYIKKGICMYIHIIAISKIFPTVSFTAVTVDSIFPS